MVVPSKPTVGTGAVRATVAVVVGTCTVHRPVLPVAVHTTMLPSARMRSLPRWALVHAPFSVGRKAAVVVGREAAGGASVEVGRLLRVAHVELDVIRPVDREGVLDRRDGLERGGHDSLPVGLTAI